MANNPWYYKLDGVLVKKMKPCMPDNYVHIKRWGGCYKVYDVTVTHFSVMKNREKVWLTWNEFECLKGEGKSELTEIKWQLKSIRTSLLFDIHKIDTVINKIKFAY